MRYRRLGRTDIEVSVVAFGAWAIAGDRTWGDQNEKEALDAIGVALDEGITLFDTAELYGNGRSEEILGRALAGRREEAIIATKPAARRSSRAEIRAACEESLRRLRTDHVDLYQLHWPCRDAPFEQQVEAMEELRAEGKIRAIGVCNFGRRDMQDYLGVGRFETNQLNYSLLWRAIEDEILPVCVENDIGVLCYSPLYQGLLTGKFRTADDVPEGRARTRLFSGSRPQARHGEPGCEREVFAAIDLLRARSRDLGVAMGTLALSWLLGRPAVASVLAGARNPAQVKENARAAEYEMPAEVAAGLSSATEAVKSYIGTDPDMWVGGEKSRMR